MVSVKDQKFLDNQERRTKRRKLINRDQLDDRVSAKHRKLLVRFFISNDYNDKQAIIKELISDSQFIRHQTDQFYRNLDNKQLLHFDLDGYKASFGISTQKAIEIKNKIDRGILPKSWTTSKVERHYRTNRFTHVYRILPNNAFGFTIGLKNKYKDQALHNLCIEFNPNLISHSEQTRFWAWLFDMMGTEIEFALDDSLLLAFDTGLQFQGVVNFMLNFICEGTVSKCYKDESIEDEILNNSVYLKRGNNLGDDSFVHYCPLSKLLIKNNRPVKYSDQRKELLLNSLCLSTRIEHKWRFVHKTDRRLKFDEFHLHCPRFEEVTLISPEIYAYLGAKPALALATKTFQGLRKNNNVKIKPICEHVAQHSKVKLDPYWIKSNKTDMYDLFHKPIKRAMKKVRS